MYTIKQFNLEPYGAFFAFGDKQLNEKIKGSKNNYCSLGGGLVCLKDKSLSLLQDMNKFGEVEVKNRIKADWIEAIIKYELGNHEAWYTWSIDDTLDSLDWYGVTYKQVLEVYKKYADEDEF